MVLTELSSPSLGQVYILYTLLLTLNLMVSSLINHSNSKLFILLVLRKHLFIVLIKIYVFLPFKLVLFKTIPVLKILTNH
jgi:hypothetical protein